MHCPAFESAVVKLQAGEDNLSHEEAHAVQTFNITAEETSAVAAPKENLTFEEEMRLAVEARKASKGAGQKYRSTFHISPTSNVVERLFSRAGIIMSPRRRQMDPSTVEMFLMLRVNKHLWTAKHHQQE